jgi:hypothetical protein
MVNRTNYLEFFFESPTLSQARHIRENRVSTLYLLRRELQECLRGQSLEDGDYLPEDHLIIDSDNCLPFSSVMIIMSGIDLLAKFYAGEDCRDRDKSTGKSKIELRFTDFLKQMGGFTQDEADRLYKVRNSLVHSFGFYHRDPNKKGKFVLRRQALQKSHLRPVHKCKPVQYSHNHWIVCIIHLHQRFMLSIKNYRSTLTGTGSREPRKKFTRMLWRYGIIAVSITDRF